MNKIDDFFKKKYEADNLANESWNLPSDTLWDNVVPELPQKKNKRKFFFLRCGFASLALLLVLNYNYKSVGKLFGSENPDEFVINHEKHLLNNQVPVSAAETEKTDVLEINDDVNIEFNNNNNNNNNNKFLHKNQINNNEEKGIESRKEKHTIIKVLPDPKYVIRNDLINSDQPITNNITKNEFVIDKQQPILNQSNILFKNEDNFNPVLDKRMLKTDIVESLNQVKTQQYLKLNTLTPIEFAKSNQLKSNFNSRVFYKPEVIQYQTHDFELGLAHSLTFFSIFNFVNPSEIDFEPGVELLDGSYKNINVSYRKWINNKISVSSALVYSKLNLNLCIDNNLLFDSDNLDFIVNKELNGVANRARSGRDLGQVKIVLKNNIFVEEGESLNMKAKVNVGIQAFQIPLYFNYSFYTRKSEYFLGVGTSIDVLMLKEQTNQLNLFRNSIQISEDQIYPELSETFVDYSIYFRSGLRRNITKHIKFGLDLKINIFEPIYTSLDFGIYYRFDKTY